jgi:hypothetical protein
MCMNCKVTDRCQCSGGMQLPTCGCAAMIWCAECNHEPADNDAPGFEVLGKMVQASYRADMPGNDNITAP